MTFNYSITSNTNYKIMKKILSFLCAAGAIMAGASCNKVTDPQTQEAENQEPQASLTINLLDGTKSTSSSSDKDKTVNNIQVLVFNMDKGGEAEAWTSSTSKDNIPSMLVSFGKKEVWAIANCDDDLSRVLSIDDLLSKQYTLDKTNVGSLLMAGKTDEPVNIITSNPSVTIAITHLQSKVTVKKITRQFSTYAQQVKDMTINGVYLINAVGASHFDGVLSDMWVNKHGHKDNAYDKVLYDAVGQSLANGNSYTTTHCFYPFPNSSTNELTTGDGSNVKTMLVVDCTLGGRPCYYPLWLPKGATETLARDKEYVIEEIVLTRPGSDTPFEPTTSAFLNVVIKPITDFGAGANYSEQI